MSKHARACRCRIGHCTDLGILDIVFGNGKFENVILEITSLKWPFSATVHPQTQRCSQKWAVLLNTKPIHSKRHDTMDWLGYFKRKYTKKELAPYPGRPSFRTWETSVEVCSSPLNFHMTKDRCQFTPKDYLQLHKWEKNGALFIAIAGCAPVTKKATH